MPRFADQLVAMRDNSNAPLFNLPQHKIEITDAVEMAHSQFKTNDQEEAKTVQFDETHSFRAKGFLNSDAVVSHFKTANVLPPFESQFLEYDQHSAMIRANVIPVDRRYDLAEFKMGAFLDCTEVECERDLIAWIKRITRRVSQFHGRATFVPPFDLDGDIAKRGSWFAGGLPIGAKRAIVFNFVALMDGQPQAPFSIPTIIFTNEKGHLVHSMEKCYTVSPLRMNIQPIADDLGKFGDLGNSECLRDFYGGSLDTPITAAHIRIGRVASMLCSYSLGLLNCKNVTVEDVEHPPKIQAKRVRKGKEPLVEYKVLSVQVGGSYKRLRDLKSKSTGEGRNALHSVRGHFANYTEDKPLFGHYVGQVFRANHMRGQEKFGEVKKEYRLRNKSEK